MKFGMVINLATCSSCGACALACKSENNTRSRGDGQSFNWADFLQETKGVFPNTTHIAVPVLCNHCENPACVAVCPTGAMYQTPEGIVMHNDDSCIGCRLCQKACPYSAETLGEESLDGMSYSVISFNPKDQSPLGQLVARPPLIPGCSASAQELAQRTGEALPYKNAFLAGDVESVRRAGVVEKCTFCYHRVSNGLAPACVEACPAGARIFGDLDDPQSNVSVCLKENPSRVLKESAGTKPKVFYIGQYSPRE